jgi:hypothetical protein
MLSVRSLSNESVVAVNTLITEMFNRVPEKRITLEGIKSHPWLASEFAQ